MNAELAMAHVPETPPGAAKPATFKSSQAWTPSARLFVVVIMTFGLSAVAIAKDIKALAEFVTPAYTAMNFALVCARHDPRFLEETGGPRGSAVAYAEHVKDETIASLTHDEALATLRMAADAARAIALQRFRSFDAADRDVESARIKAWCESHGRQQVRSFVEHHDSDHAAIITQLREAQR